MMATELYTDKFPSGGEHHRSLPALLRVLENLNALEWGQLVADLRSSYFPTGFFQKIEREIVGVADRGRRYLNP